MGIPREFYRLETNEKFHKPGPNKVYCKIFAVSMKQKRKKPGRPEPERPLRGSGEVPARHRTLVLLLMMIAVIFSDGRRFLRGKGVSLTIAGLLIYTKTGSFPSLISCKKP